MKSCLRRIAVIVMVK